MKNDGWTKGKDASVIESFAEESEARGGDRNRDGVVHWCNVTDQQRDTEGINSLIQAAKARARGYRSAAISSP